MDKIHSALIVSRFEEDYSWVSDYSLSNKYIIYNKGVPIQGDPHVINVDNIGGNQKDILEFVYSSYSIMQFFYEVFGDAPSYAFVQANPFDHCKKEVFDKLIYNRCFTPLEYYGSTPANGYENRSEDGGFMEINNSWYISAHNKAHNQTCKYSSFDEFMNKYFEDYSHLDWVRFSPGSQYIIEANQFLQYPRIFWRTLSDELTTKSPTEGHIIERALYYILTGKYKLREVDYWLKT